MKARKIAENGKERKKDEGRIKALSAQIRRQN